ncbi:MAG: DUF1934 domain-containing protein [Clostridia bacterium]|nr:DUF1934 domain-containing protein [Clostridia bacterium]MBR0509361.1 DUF1934 domain-containing protein [Clostridia bacterium]MBR0537635.1 DUF1934 domain-containing protein [Clostridia bacterium]
MEYDRIIKILNTERIGGGEESLEITTRGALQGDANDYSLSYYEHLGAGLDCTTRIHVKDKRFVSIMRQGAINSLITMEPGNRHQCIYSTPYGDLPIGVWTNELSSDIDVHGGELRLKYVVDFDGPIPGQRKNMKITVSDIQQKGSAEND